MSNVKFAICLLLVVVVLVIGGWFFVYSDYFQPKQIAQIQIIPMINETVVLQTQ